MTATARLKGFAKRHNILFAALYPIVWLRREKIRRQDQAFDKFYTNAFKIVEQGSVVVQLAELKGTFEIDVRSHLLRTILKDQAFEHEVVALVKQHLDPGRDVVDIGANIGLFTVLFAKTIAAERRVLAIEPIPAALSCLRRNLARNSVSQAVILFEGVASEQDGEYEIHTIAGREEYSSLGAIVHPAAVGQSFQTLKVKGIRVDDLVEQHNLSPGLIKIDTEGAEYQVLSGAMGTLERQRPVILSELSDTLLAGFGTNAQQVVHLLQSHGYEVINCDAPGAPLKYPFVGEILAVPTTTSSSKGA